MAEVDISSLKETLRAQQRLLQKLYNELDAEREASSTAASEALSVILRLQAEKAAVKMEAEHYKRLAEEKMCHAEESLAIFEDVIYQKELEVAALNHQVRAYRYKLLGIGGVDLGVDEIRFPENLSQSNETLAGDTSCQSMGRRNSLPVSLKYSYPKKATIHGEGSATPEMDLISKIVDEHTKQEIDDHISDIEKKTESSTTSDINSYWQQVRKLEEQVKEIAGGNYENFTRSPSTLSSQLSSGNQYDPANLRSKTRSPSPQLSTGNPFEPESTSVVNEIGETKIAGNISENGTRTDSPCSLSVHDVFEVPRVDQSCKRHCDWPTKDDKKIAYQVNEGLETAYSVHPEAVKLGDNGEPDWLKKLLQSIHHENNLSAINCCMAVDRPTASVSELNQLNNTSEIVENERPTVGQESTNRMEELRLLNEIKETINSLQYEIRSYKIKKSSREEKPSLVPLMEEMLHFWL